MSVLSFLAGAFLGAAAGMFAMALLVASARCQEAADATEHLRDE